MFEKDKLLIKYTREEYTYCEKLYEQYMEMRKVLKAIENIKYDNVDPMQLSEEFKQGFIAGIKIMSSILMDL